MIRKASTLAMTALLALSACSGGGPQQEYIDGVRAAFPGIDDNEVHELAESICNLVETAIGKGMSNEEAIDYAYTFSIDEGIPEVDAFLMVTSAVGGWCPMDISED